MNLHNLRMCPVRVCYREWFVSRQGRCGAALENEDCRMWRLSPGGGALYGYRGEGFVYWRGTFRLYGVLVYECC